MNMLKTFVFNVILFVLAYFAFVENISGAYNVLAFMITITMFVGIYLGSDDGSLALSKLPPRTFFSKIYRTTDIVLVLILVWYGSWILGIMLLIGVICTEIGAESADKMRKSSNYLKNAIQQEKIYD